MKAAVIGAGQESLHTINKARELGLTVIALDGDAGAAGLPAADRGIHVDIADEAQTIAVLRQEKVDFLLTPPIGRVLTSVGAANDALRLPGISREAAYLCTDKYLFHQRLQEARLRNCHCYLAGEEMGELSYPAIMKPRFGSGSKGIFWLRSPRETEQALRIVAGKGKGDRPEKSADYLIEEAVAGEEYGVDGAMDREGFHLVLLRRKLLTPPPARQAVGYLSVVPSREERLPACEEKLPTGEERLPAREEKLPTEEAKLTARVQEYLSRVTACLGLRDCLLHADLIVREDLIFVIELSARPSGHNLHNLFTPLASGIDMAAEYIKCRIGRPYSYAPAHTDKMLIRYFDLTGQLTSVPEESSIHILLQKKGDVRLNCWQCNLQPGDTLPPVNTGASLMGRGYFILTGGEDMELIKTGEEILELFSVV